MDKKLLIKQARNMMLRSLDKVYPGGLTPKLLHLVMCTAGESYDFDLMKKDIAYLREKGYLELSSTKKRTTLADIHERSIAVVKITAEGLDVIQDLRDDPALEI